MHIKDHSAAMKFFRTYDSAASKGKWKEFVDEMEFDSMLQEPRTMANGGRIGLSDGQLVTPSVDGSRPGYGGKGGSSPEYRASLLEKLPDGYLEDYKANFYNTIEDGKLTHVGGKQPPSVKGSQKKGIPYMIEKYGDVIKKTYVTRQGPVKNLYGKVKDINSALKASFQSQIKSGKKMGYAIRIGQLRAIGGWYPKAPKGMATHHFLPKIPMEGSSINFASTRNTAFISSKLNADMSPYDTKLKAIQLEQIKLFQEKKPGWEKSIKELNVKATQVYEDAAKNVPDSKGYLGYSQMKIKPNGTYTIKITGLDPSLSLSGKDPKKEIFYRNPKTFEPISREDKLKVNRMSNIKSFSEYKKKGGTWGKIDYEKFAKKFIKDDIKFASFPANVGAMWKTLGSGARKTLGWGTAFLSELIFAGLDMKNEMSKGKSTEEAASIAKRNATLGIYSDDVYLKELIKVGDDMDIDTRPFEKVFALNEDVYETDKYFNRGTERIKAYRELGKDKAADDLQKNLDVYMERKNAGQEKAIEGIAGQVSISKAGEVFPSPNLDQIADSRYTLTNEEFAKTFTDVQEAGIEKLKKEKTKAFDVQSKQVDTEAGSIGDPLIDYTFNLPAWHWKSILGVEEAPHLKERRHIKEMLEFSPQELYRYNLARGVDPDNPITQESFENLVYEQPGLGFSGAEGGIASLKKKW